MVKNNVISTLCLEGNYNHTFGKRYMGSHRNIMKIIMWSQIAKGKYMMKLLLKTDLWELIMDKA